MSRYIDADKLMLVLNDWQFLSAPFREEESSIVYDTIGGAMEYVKEQPTADVQEVRHGRWEPYLNEGLIVKCSVCGSRYIEPWNYCPNCGAKMDEVTA